eukprot:CAMPEP_0195161354 /NCGR_PEP_ID=MMETSP0448-20130528/187120_1 /TAXON_ID=66468 /ORGANISM="Heterocapsa triquestra, Strain CCMP 448" /LENGTH=246 /DNA_ID=CAMNT_0040200153 /DNA_START=132 /DNA_END=872 /DNA_ORIENTATION=+
MAVVVSAASVGAAPSKREVCQLSLADMLMEPARDSRQGPLQPVLTRPPGVHLPQGMRPPPGLSLPSKPVTPVVDDMFLSLSPRKVILEDHFEEASNCSTTDVQETISSGMSTPPLSPVVAAPEAQPSLLQLGESLPPTPPPGLSVQSGELPKQMLQLSKAFPVPFVGSPECPSVGTIGHKLGLCQPCDFVHRGGCRAGAACKYCHLCQPLDQKRQRRERQRCMRARRRLQPSDGQGVPGSLQPWQL